MPRHLVGVVGSTGGCMSGQFVRVVPNSLVDNLSEVPMPCASHSGNRQLVCISALQQILPAGPEAVAVSDGHCPMVRGQGTLCLIGGGAACWVLAATLILQILFGT